MSYAISLMNHMRSVRRCADAMGAEVHLDLRTLLLEVKCRNRYYALRPCFVGRHDGRMFYAEQLVDDAFGFLGWFPYEALRHELSDDKRLFKGVVTAAGLRVPASWEAHAPAGDFLLKRSAGSFGYEITGPYRKGSARVQEPPPMPSIDGSQGTVFAEQFVQGDALKVWYWGDRPFFAHRQAWPVVVGDGQATVAQLAARRLGVPTEELPAAPDHPFLAWSVAYQDLSLDQVLPEGRKAWLDYRYGRTYAPPPHAQRSDDVLQQLPSSAREAAASLGKAIWPELHKRFGAPVLHAVDGVLAADGEVWWLEINVNPVLPPDAYALMFASLFPPLRKPG